MSRVNKHLRLFRQWQDTAGLGPAFSWEFVKLRHKLGVEPNLWRVRPKQVDHELGVRFPSSISSDVDVFHQIFIAEEYAAMRDIENVKTVIDLGANVGYTSAFFLSCFPGCRVLAVEPDSVNLEQCSRNLAPYGKRVELLKGAVWSSGGKLSVERGLHGDGMDWGTQVRETKPEDALPVVEGWDMPTLIAKLGGGPIDVLKIDIEGAEREILRSGAREWLLEVRNLCIELHGEECQQVFMAAMADFEYELSRSGELTICRDIRARPGRPSIGPARPNQNVDHHEAGHL